ncbi:MAG: T9SS type A sorting domain-containing protein, partial [Candidatus Lokiarchaeota archaeon]|nr:T9SS type A sorting domain-containing protein [Candidatus Lokiarchaeota archaeon]
AEIYEDNNLFIKSFYVIRDTITTSVSETSVTATFDGQEILDGDYVSSNPEILIDFSYPLWFPIDDTSAIKIYLDNIELSYSDFDVNYDTINRIIQYSFKPTILEGLHNLKVFGKDINGVIGSTPGFEKYFTVSNEFALLNLYNYPNPFSEKTSFTFILPVLPEELKINIYSIAGRKIKEIKKIMNELIVGFNKIDWDGKDEDGDVVANGSYLYKVIIRNAENSFSTTQKLSKVK